MIDVELPPVTGPRFLGRSKWIRARRGGLVEIDVGLGDAVEQGQVVARISDAFGVRPTRVKSTTGGWVISRTLTPLVNPGDPLVNVGS
jgi:predicted deacylase